MFGFGTSRLFDVRSIFSPHGLPAMYGFREFVEAGGLLSYAADLAESYRKNALQGGHDPADPEIFQEDEAYHPAIA